MSGPNPTNDSSSQHSASQETHRGNSDTRQRVVQTNVYHQQGSQGPIFNGPIHGGVKNFLVSNVDALHFLYQHAATGAMHDSDERFPPPLCHPGTREAVIYRILDWYGYQQGPGKPIMWVYAPAGYGKTAIAGTVAQMLEEKSAELDFSPIGATFFFWRTSQERNSPARFIVTIAYQLSMSIPELAPHIETAVMQNPMILRKALEVQLRKLIVEPFKALGDTRDMPNRLVIIDGLDECINSDRESRVVKRYAEDQEIVQVRVLDLIHILASSQLPLSFLLLSRPEAWIKQHIESQQFEDLVESVDFYEVGDHIEDVETFVRAELSRIGVGEERLVERLMRRANGHMLYASTVIRHIDCPYDDPQKRLQNILNDYVNSNPDLTHSTPFSSLYELYRQILRSSPEGNRSVMMDVLGELYVGSFCFDDDVAMHRALSVFDHMFGRIPGIGMKAIRGLHAVLRVSEGSIPATQMLNRGPYFIHSSFCEFLTDPRLSLEFYIDKNEKYRRLLLQCLDCMSSITLDSEMDDDHLRYVLVSWPPVWREWEPSKADAVEMLPKLIDIDLMACFVHAFTLDSVFHYRLRPSFDLCFDDHLNGLVAEGPLEVYECNPCVQQAISHVAASQKAAILHLLQRQCLGTNPYFPEAVFYFLLQLLDPENDAVVYALKTLQRESPEIFDKLMVDVEVLYQDYVENFIDEESMEDYDTLFAFIRSDQ